MILACLAGCEPVKSERDVYGRYVLKSNYANITLDVAEDHSYSETILYPAGEQQKQSGKWHWRDGQACFGGLLVPNQLLKDLYENAPQQNHPKTRGSAYELDDCLPASREYGKTLLEINPDSPENFEKLTDAGGAHALSNLAGGTASGFKFSDGLFLAKTPSGPQSAHDQRIVWIILRQAPASTRRFL
jgi:hypothetical protein